MNESIEDIRKRGNTEFKNKNFEQAEIIYSEGIERYPKNPLLYSNRAITRQNLGKFKNALEDIDLAIAIDKNSAKYRYLKGKCLEKLQFKYQALKSLSEALDLNIELCEAGDLLESIIIDIFYESLDKSYQILTSKPSTTKELAIEAQTYMGKESNSPEEQEKKLKTLKCTWIRMKSADEAVFGMPREMWEKLKCFILKEIAGVYNSMKDYNTSIACVLLSLHRASSLKLDAVLKQSFTNLLVTAYINAAQFQEAKKWLQINLSILETFTNLGSNREKDEQISSGYNLLGRIYSVQGKHYNAIQSYQKSKFMAIKLNNFERKVRIGINLGKAYMELGNFADAIKELKYSIEFAKNIPKLSYYERTGYLLSAWCYFEQQEYQSALDIITPFKSESESEKNITYQHLTYRANRDSEIEISIESEVEFLGAICLLRKENLEKVSDMSKMHLAKAKVLMLKSLETHKTNNDHLQHLQCLVTIASICSAGDELEEAINYFKMAIDEGEKV